MTPHAETYMGLVEIGVGLLPAGGGTKEMALRAMILADENSAEITPFIFKNFMNIGMAKVSSSASELVPMGFMSSGDAITMNISKRIHDAKLKVMAMAANYRPGRPMTGLKAPAGAWRQASSPSSGICKRAASSPSTTSFWGEPSPTSLPAVICLAAL